jgi:hypothetical protein
LKELRLSQNKIAYIPNDITELVPLSLEILDLAGNSIKSIKDIENLKPYSKVTNLNLKGNPVSSVKGYREKVLEILPSLRILDGDRFDEKFIARKQKRKVMEIKKSIKETRKRPTGQTDDEKEDSDMKTESKNEQGMSKDHGKDKLSAKRKNKEPTESKKKKRKNEPKEETEVIVKPSPFEKIQKEISAKTAQITNVSNVKQVDNDTPTIENVENAPSGILKIETKKVKKPASFDPSLLQQEDTFGVSGWD